MAQMIKNLPAMQETGVWSLGQKGLLEKEMVPTPVFLPGEFHGQRSLVNYSPWGCKTQDITEWLTLSLFNHKCFSDGCMLFFDIQNMDIFVLFFLSSSFWRVCGEGFYQSSHLAIVGNSLSIGLDILSITYSSMCKAISILFYLKK